MPPPRRRPGQARPNGGLDVSVSGADRFKALSDQLRAAGRGDLVKELQKALRDAVKPITPKSRAEATKRLPQSGGLAGKVAKAPQRVTARAGQSSASLRLTIAGKRSGAYGADKGKVRHPVFGRRGKWVEQQVKPGWFTDVVEAEKPQVRDEVVKVLDDFRDRIIRGV